MTNIRINISSDTTPKRYVGWRALHAVEGGLSNPSGMPAVRPATNADNIWFESDMQWLAYDLNEGRLTKSKFHQLYERNTAFTNEQSWYEGDEVIHRADYVNGIDLDYASPKLCKAIIMGGGFYTGRAEGNYLVMVPGVDAIDVTKPLPSVAEVLRRHWYFHAVTSGEKIYNFPHCGVGVPVLIPYFLEVAVKYPKVWFESWDRDFLPDPLMIYNRP